jgi:three-Cys-motif partner protein
VPTDKYTEARHQTQHKLETMERYWGAWTTILARTVGKFAFCPGRLWLIDTHSAEGRHRNDEDPLGEVPGTAVLAALAARRAQAQFPAITATVRASDIRPAIAGELDERFAVIRAAGVDATARASDWVDVVPGILREIADEEHPHLGLAGGRPHDHRSLWFVDPYGIESIDHAVLLSLPRGAEVIINLDLAVLPRHVARAANEEAGIVAILDKAFGGAAWRKLIGVSDLTALARGFAAAYPLSKWPFQEAHLLRATGSQYRALVHLSGSPTARDTFARDVRTAGAAGTLVAGEILSKPQKDAGAKRLHELFRGLSVTPREMQPAFTWSLTQLRAICNAADAIGLGRWDGTTMHWGDEPLKAAGSQAPLWDS